MSLFKTYSEFLSEKFPGFKVQKISVNAGFSCPNRDGTIGHGGCIYCNNSAFTPGYAIKKGSNNTVREQIERGKEFFGRKYPEMRYLAYFQSYTNTFTTSRSDLEELYRTAISSPEVIGLIIGTRPDCVPEKTVEVLERINREKPVFIEFGAESFHDRTLLAINRGHKVSETVDGVRRLAAAGISVGLHLIFGLPGENDSDMLDSVRQAVLLPIDTLKFHHLQIIADTPLAGKWRRGELIARDDAAEVTRSDEITLWNTDRYIDFCRRVIDIVPPTIAIERFTASAPENILIAPRWGLKNYQFMNLLTSRRCIK